MTLPPTTPTATGPHRPTFQGEARGQATQRPARAPSPRTTHTATAARIPVAAGRAATVASRLCHRSSAGAQVLPPRSASPQAWWAALLHHAPALRHLAPRRSSVWGGRLPGHPRVSTRPWPPRRRPRPSTSSHSSLRRSGTRAAPAARGGARRSSRRADSLPFLHLDSLASQMLACWFLPRFFFSSCHS